MARITGTDTLGIEDLNKLVRALKELDKDLPKRLRKVGKVVADIVADHARGAGTGLGSVAAKVAPSIKGSAGANFAAVSGGGPGYEMFGGAEFGSAHDKPRQRSSGTYLGYNQFQPWAGGGRGQDTGGYFLWPTIRKDMPLIEEKYVEGVNELLQEVGLK